MTLYQLQMGLKSIQGTSFHNIKWMQYEALLDLFFFFLQIHEP